MFTSLVGKCVLIVDDDDGMRALIRRMLNRMRIENIVEAASARQALERMEQPTSAAFDLIICDWNMPEMSGIDLFTKVHAKSPDLPFLMLTCRDDAQSVIAAKNAGVAAYIVKPVAPAELQAKIRFLAAPSNWRATTGRTFAPVPGTRDIADG